MNILDTKYYNSIQTSRYHIDFNNENEKNRTVRIFKSRKNINFTYKNWEIWIVFFVNHAAVYVWNTKTCIKGQK